MDRRGRHLWRNPLGRHPEIASHAHWVEPLLVGRIEFREATSGSLRHPAWKGIRSDVLPEQVRAPAP
ncbi:hypothetical protein ACLMAL_37605 [Nocardia sp. CWNU-33]|uniref:ATP dependent DNA ligase n=1 Tax=Nocardia sp. CWNU-33 TaxID=3392117 RepID=UPI00398E5DED